MRYERWRDYSSLGSSSREEKTADYADYRSRSRMIRTYVLVSNVSIMSTPDVPQIPYDIYESPQELVILLPL
jgi:hypothetical protein